MVDALVLERPAWYDASQRLRPCMQLAVIRIGSTDHVRKAHACLQIAAVRLQRQHKRHGALRARGENRSLQAERGGKQGATLMVRKYRLRSGMHDDAGIVLRQAFGDVGVFGEWTAA